ncbi:TetR/AcrR family transcriptional regulator [Streptomyces sp. NPDC092296]|uniref:TetR/AcrR family transcriptional regulator n=1 Tax=Streptomyces sp. NPDC092296 TaxID=3366012 RepID=UPI0038022970
MRVPTAERRQQLIEAAVELMRRNGVDAVTLRAIAQEAGAPLATLHYCFRDKDELMRAAAQHWLGQFMQDSIPERLPLEAGLRATVRRISEAFWASLRAGSEDFRAQIELVTWAVRGGMHPMLAESMYAHHEEKLGEVFAAALEAAGEQSSVDPGILARGYVAALDGITLQFVAEPENPRLPEVFDLMMESLLTQAEV